MAQCPLDPSCKCTDCRANRAARQRRYRVRLAETRYGIVHDTDQVPIGPVRQRLRAANRHGTTFREMEKLTGIARRDLQRIANGNRTWIQRKTHHKVMYGLPDSDIRAFQETTMVPAHKSRQIIHSLAAQGWSQNHLTDIIRNNTDRSGAFLKHFSSAKKTHVFKENEDLLLWLAEQIGSRQGPGKKSITWANKNGYFPLKHYDPKGELVESSLNSEQRELFRSVR